MKKHDLSKLALLGMATGILALSGEASANSNNSSQYLAQGTDHYICAQYKNCGKCGGQCNLKNPDTPGLTPDQKKQAEEYQKKHKEDKNNKKPQTPPGSESGSADDCGAFCSAANESSVSSNHLDKSASMKAKRKNI